MKEVMFELKTMTHPYIQDLALQGEQTQSAKAQDSNKHCMFKQKGKTPQYTCSYSYPGHYGWGGCEGKGKTTRQQQVLMGLKGHCKEFRLYSAMDTRVFWLGTSMI